MMVVRWWERRLGATPGELWHRGGPVPCSTIPAQSSMTRSPPGGVAPHYFHWLPLALALASLIWTVLDLSARGRHML